MNLGEALDKVEIDFDTDMDILPIESMTSYTDTINLISSIYNDIDAEFESLLSAIKYTKDKDLIVTLIKQAQHALKGA